MQITFFSFFTSVVWSSLLVAIIFLLRKKYFFIRQFGIVSLLLLYLFCVVRMAIPIEFTFTKGLTSEGIVSIVYQTIGIDKLGTSGMSILMLLSVVWAVVSLVLLIRFYYQYNKVMMEVSSYGIWEDEQCKRVFVQVMDKSKKRKRIEIRCNENVNVPMGIGIFKKTIILPERDYSDEDLYYILLHEYTHFLNKDILMKMLIHVFCCMFWWNPVVYLLRRDLNQTLEIKCDLCVTEQLDKNGIVSYLTTIVSTLKRANDKKTKTFCGTAALVSNDYDSEVVERFRIVSKNIKLLNKNKALTAIWFMAFIVIILFSYSFVVLPYYEAPIEEIETGPDTYEIRTDNSYILKNEDGTYTMVMPSGEKQDIEEEFALNMESQGFKILEEEN